MFNPILLSHVSCICTSLFRLARRDVFDENHGDRPDQNNVILLITDGESNVDANLTIREATLLKDRVSTQGVITEYSQ